MEDTYSGKIAFLYYTRSAPQVQDFLHLLRQTNVFGKMYFACLKLLFFSQELIGEHQNRQNCHFFHEDHYLCKVARVHTCRNASVMRCRCDVRHTTTQTLAFRVGCKQNLCPVAQQTRMDLRGRIPVKVSGTPTCCFVRYDTEDLSLRVSPAMPAPRCPVAALRMQCPPHSVGASHTGGYRRTTFAAAICSMRLQIAV